MNDSKETIVAVATPPGRGGIGVVRLSGALSSAIVTDLVRLPRALNPGRQVVGELVDESGERVDEVIVSFFRAPHSYTREDVVEISAHGAPVVLEYVVRAAVEKGARVAEPGEFTRRALRNGRLQLTEAEAVRDLIEAQTLFQAKVAAQQLGGALSRRVAPIKSGLLHLIARLEAGIDFADDDVETVSGEEILRRLAPIEERLTSLLASFRVGHFVHQGLTLAIVGRPNVGKSSLFNRLLERERAIVTDIAGTTRDPISESMAIDGVPIRLVDTAGIRKIDEAGPVERIGIERSYAMSADADAVLLLFDASAGWCAADQTIFESLEARAPILIGNKSDLGVREQKAGAVLTSATTGEGVDALRQTLWQKVAGSKFEMESGALTSVRHEQTTREAAQALERAHAAVKQSVPHEMLLMDLYAGLHALDALTGETTPDDVLDVIFSTFCIGK